MSSHNRWNTHIKFNTHANCLFVKFRFPFPYSRSHSKEKRKMKHVAHAMFSMQRIELFISINKITVCSAYPNIGANGLPFGSIHPIQQSNINKSNQTDQQSNWENYSYYPPPPTLPFTWLIKLSVIETAAILNRMNIGRIWAPSVFNCILMLSERRIISILNTEIHRTNTVLKSSRKEKNKTKMHSIPKPFVTV